MGTENKKFRHDGYSPRELEIIKDTEKKEGKRYWEGGYQPDPLPDTSTRNEKIPPKGPSSGN